VVIDSSALIAVLTKEHGYEILLDAIEPDPGQNYCCGDGA
jgi:uncharacterized protein with PIN domain